MIEQFDVYKKGWARINENGKFGFISREGRVVVRPKYISINNFNEYRKGWARVSVENNKFGFINSDGKEVVPTVYDNVEVFKKKTPADQ